MSEEKITITIVDDHPMITEGLRAIIQNSNTLAVGKCFSNGGDFRAYLDTQTVEFIILDLGLPDTNGLEICLDIKAKYATAKVLFLTNHLDRGFITQALQNGANGYLLKSSTPDEILHAIYKIIKGELAFCEEVVAVLTQPGAEKLDRSVRLTRREQEILELISKGQKTNLIASTLFISPLTVETHRRNLLQKLGASNMAELISTAMRVGLIK